MVELRSMVASIIEARLRLSKLMLREEEGGLAKICQDGWFNGLAIMMSTRCCVCEACLRPLIWASVLFGMLVYTVAVAWMGLGSLFRCFLNNAVEQTE